MQPIKIPVKVFSVDIYFIVCSFERLTELAKDKTDIDISELEDSSAGVVGNLIWIHEEVKRGSIDFIRNVAHEVSHVVDSIMLDLGLEGTEVRAYINDYLTGVIMESVKDDFNFKE